MANTEPKKPGAKKTPASKAAKGPAPEKRNTKARTVGMLAVGLIIVVAALALNAGGLAKMAVQKIAGDTLGVKVSLAGLDVSLQERQVDATGLDIANPAGYQADSAIKIGGIHIAAGEISRQKLVFDKIRATGTVINLEVLQNQTNLMTLRENLDANASGEEGDAAPVKVVIHELLIEGATLNPLVTLAGTQMQPVNMPDIRITGIGEAEGGVTPSEAMALITDRLIRVAMRTAVQNQYLQGMDQQVLVQIQEALGLPTGFMDQVRGIGEAVRGLFQD